MSALLTKLVERRNLVDREEFVRMRLSKDRQEAEKRLAQSSESFDKMKLKLHNTVVWAEVETFLRATSIRSAIPGYFNEDLDVETTYLRIRTSRITSLPQKTLRDPQCQTYLLPCSGRIAHVVLPCIF